jgi:membrane fusion protein (multidrug efflux system)
VSATFSHTTRALEADRGRGGLIALGAGLVLLVAWGVWMLRARVTEWSVSDNARVEVGRSAHAVDAPIAGRVVQNKLTLGAAVHAGDLVVELDAEPEKRRLAEERVRLAAIDPELEALRRALGAREQVITSDRAALAAAVEQGKARERESLVGAELAREEAARANKLYDGGAIAELELLRARTEAERRKAATSALGFDVARQRGEQQTRETETRAIIEQMRKDIVVLEGQRATTQATIDRLAYEIERKLVRAPIDGKVGDATALQPGAFVAEGARLGSIVPSDAVRVVSAFQPGTALGRVRPGQRARVRLEGFPWTEYGMVDAVVARVGTEPQSNQKGGQKDGLVRVELDVKPDPASRIPLEHGLVGTVEVAVDEKTPAALVLGAIGKAVTAEAKKAP